MTNLNSCVCCGQNFDSLSKLMEHLKTEHTSAEVLVAVGSTDSDPHKNKSKSA